MHGREGERRIHRRHMWSVPAALPTPSVAASDSTTAVITPDSFSKDGRKICVGDCALFKPPQDSPPFIGIIRKLLLEKEKSLSLSVNWLYRPADVKLGKGSLLEAAPNELFYSFHKDEIPAASLLHPCKIAFLRKGVELPSGISSFVCRRVYDTENRCLWWLTDQDYINERQEEVDQLLDKTRLEMYGGVQSGGRSPKRLNGSTGTPQLRPVSESVQNSSSSLSSQAKGKKRDRVDQGSDPVKRERVSRADDTDSGPECTLWQDTLKSEIAKITNKGGLVDFEGVEKLLQLMQPDSAEKKIDLACRMMLVDVIAVTDRFDCLGRFVQLRGLPVLDEWLQEGHKGKIGDGSSPRESDKSVEELLLALLRALDKLPVNLHALKTCNVGKSVNHLRGHKNPEIQKKARTLVDTWKKRVEAEMNIIDAKSGSSHGGSWPSKSLLSEVSHAASRRNGGSFEVNVKSSTIQSSASKNPSVKLGSAEAVAKIVSASPSSTKSAASPSSAGGASAKDTNSVALVHGGSPDMPLSTIKEEKSTSSSQSQNNSQSCSSDHAKTGSSSCREDARTSTAGSVSVSKISGSASHHRKSSNGVQGLAVSGVQKETNLGKSSSLSRNMASEKMPPTTGTYDRVNDVPLVDHASSQRLIVRLPNTGRSPAQSASGGSLEDPIATLSKAAPSAQSEKLDHDRKVKAKTDALRASNAPNSKLDLGQVRDGVIKFDECNASSSYPLSYEQSRTADGEKLMESSKGGDDIGMNLLASVAAGEMSRCDVSLSDSPGKNSPIPAESCSGNDVKSRHLDEDTTRFLDLANDRENGSDKLEQDVKVTSLGCEDKTGECSGQLNSSSYLKCDGKPGHVNDASVALSSEISATEGNVKSEGADEFHPKRMSGHVRVMINSVLSSIPEASNPLSDEDNKVNHADEKIIESGTGNAPEAAASVKGKMEANEESPSCLSSEKCGEEESVVPKESGCGVLTEQKVPITAKIHHESIGVKSEATTLPSGSANVSGLQPNSKSATDMKAVNQTEQSEKQNIVSCSTILDKKGEYFEKTEGKETGDHCADGSTSHENTSTIPVTVECSKSDAGKLDGNEAGGKGKCGSSVNASFGSVARSDLAVKLDFDLNEGFPADDGCQGEPAKLSVPGNSSTLHLPCPLPFPISSMSASFPASITFTSAAKGPFYPPESPLRSKGELGWKGSAATSAFRPAEPRKALDMPLKTTCYPSVDNVTSKQERHPLDIDLNVPDQRVLDDVASQKSAQATCLDFGPLDHRGGGLDLDLNRVDGSPDTGHFSVSNSNKFEIPQFYNRPSLSGGFSNAQLNASRDFDLNDGPGPDEGVTEIARRAKGNLTFLSPLTGIRVNNGDQGNFSTLFPLSNSSSAIGIPSILPGRGEQSYSIAPANGSQRILGPPIDGSPFAPEFFRGTLLSSSPAVPFHPASPFQYSGFPFDTSFSLSSNSYSGGSTAYVDSFSGGQIRLPAIPSQLVGPSGVVSSHYPRPYVMNLPGGTDNVAPESRKWGGHALDLNSGPGSTDVERRDERLPSALRQLPLPGSHAPVDEQIKMFQMAGGLLKRKEPDGGWDGDRISYKQPSWQ